MYNIQVIIHSHAHVPAIDLPIGTFATILDGQYKGHLVLRTYHDLVSLTDPAVSWHIPCSHLDDQGLDIPPSIICSILPKGTHINIEI